MSIPLTVQNILNGAAVERIHTEIQNCLANIVDPNTTAKKTREVVMKITIKPNEGRNMGEVFVQTSSKLQSPAPLETSITIGHDPRTGEVSAEEMCAGENPNQLAFPGTMENAKITSFNRSAGGM